jgi:branched-chain amino acid transport system ATP-binding protein
LLDPRRGETLPSDPENAAAPRLALEGIATFYGEAQVLREISLTVRAGQIVALLGSNGAGKTTLLKTLTGLLVPRSGSILFEGRRIEGLPAHRVIARGIASVPEGRELFGSLNVMDNLLIGTYSLTGEKRKEALNDRLRMVFSLFPILEQRLKQKAETLSGGQQQMLAIGRALMAMPKLLALDEPSLGLSPLLVAEVMRVLKEIAQRGDISLLLVEQNARAALKIADYVYVLERGEIVLSGPVGEVVDSPVIQSAYLGG